MRKGRGEVGTRSYNPALAHCPGPRRVACISLTASSIEEPQPSLRISTPKILAAAICAVFVGAGDGDIEGQDLIGVPGISQLFVAADFRKAQVIDLVDGGADGGADRADQAGGEDGLGAHNGVLILGSDLVDVGHELAAGFLEEVQESVAVEVDPYHRAGDAALVCASRNGSWPSRQIFWVNACKLLKKLAGTTRLELATSAVTGQRSNQLNYVPSFFSSG